MGLAGVAPTGVTRVPLALPFLLVKTSNMKGGDKSLRVTIGKGGDQNSGGTLSEVTPPSFHPDSCFHFTLEIPANCLRVSLHLQFTLEGACNFTLEGWLPLTSPRRGPGAACSFTLEGLFSLACNSSGRGEEDWEGCL